MKVFGKRKQKENNKKEDDDDVLLIAVTPTQNGTDDNDHTIVVSSPKNDNNDVSNRSRKGDIKKTAATTTKSSSPSDTTTTSTNLTNLTIQEEINILKDEINLLKQRNYEKDRGKDFEGSYTRTVFLMVITYATLFCYMYFVLKTARPALDAIVPTVGFNISTWGLPYVKEWWVQIQYYRRHGEFEKITKLTPTSHKEFTTKRHQIIEAASTIPHPSKKQQHGETTTTPQTSYDDIEKQQHQQGK